MDALIGTLKRLLDYPSWEVVVELAILWILIFIAYRFIKGTRAAGAVKGVLVVFVVATLTLRIIEDTGVLPRIGALYNSILGLAAVALLITFQPELRRAFIRLGESPFTRSSRDEARDTAQAIARSAGFLSKNKFGAILAIERSVGLRDFAETGRTLNADISDHLLNSIFWPSSPLHDMGVVIRGDKILAAGVQFPLAVPAEMPLTHLGTRHRAAVGLAKRTDAVVIVVSEETGTISIAEDGTLRRGLTPDQLQTLIVERLAGNGSIDEPLAVQDDPEGTHLIAPLDAESGSTTHERSATRAKRDPTTSTRTSRRRTTRSDA